MAKKTTSAKKRNVKVSAQGQLHVHSSFNNIIVTLANSEGHSRLCQGCIRLGLEKSHRLC